MRSILALLFLAACGADATSGPDAGTDLRTLETCTTSIADDVPAFYGKYFACATITVAGDGMVTIATDDLPPHPSYYYGAGDPNYVDFDTSRGDEYHPNPNVLAAQSIRIGIPAAPAARGLTITEAMVDGIAGTSPYEMPGGPIGVALDSVALFSGLAAPGDDIAEERFTFDAYQAHPAPGGEYHYHTVMPGPLEVLAARDVAGVELFGIQCDGTVVLGCTELDGSAPTGTLDGQGGHVGDLVDEEGTVHFTARYHTHVCANGHAYTPEIQYYSTCSPS
jgi:hypothetical protein